MENTERGGESYKEGQLVNAEGIQRIKLGKTILEIIWRQVCECGLRHSLQMHIPTSTLLGTTARTYSSYDELFVCDPFGYPLKSDPLAEKRPEI